LTALPANFRSFSHSLSLPLPPLLEFQVFLTPSFFLSLSRSLSPRSCSLSIEEGEEGWEPSESEREPERKRKRRKEEGGREEENTDLFLSPYTLSLSL
jgi:hypothetical protein